MSIKNSDRSVFSLIGFLLSEIGLGQSARNIAHSMKGEKLSAKLVNVNLEGRSNDQEFAAECVPYQPGLVNFTVCGLGLVNHLYSAISEVGLGSKNYLYPFWELDRIPNSKLKDLAAFDEIIAPSNFIAETLSNFLGKSIRTIHQPVLIPKNVVPNSINDGILRVYGAVDFDSFVARKNPLGILKAFQAAFSDKYDDVELILKVRGGNDLGARHILQSAVCSDHRIKIIDKTLNRDEMNFLSDACNVYLSMHRSEGFGFGPAEALAAEKIVVSTDYGGTCDFITKKTGYPIDFKLTQ